MAKRILIVEDERVVARSLQHTLRNLGYDVSGVVSSGENAIRRSEETAPDLVLMDIVLKGNLDGIETAKQIYSRFNIPVVYLTAHADESTLQRAKITEPFGYIIKPFEIRALRSAIEIALYKHNIERKVKDKKQWLAVTLKNIDDGVISIDENGLIKVMNPIAEVITGWRQEDALGKNLIDVFNIIDEESRDIITENLVKKATREGAFVELTDRKILLVAKNGAEVSIDVGAAPLRDNKGGITGVVLVFRDTTKNGRLETRTLRTQALKPRDKTRLMIVSSTIFREGIYKILEFDRDIEVTAETSTSLEIIPLLKQKKADVLLIDTAIPGLDITEILEFIRERGLATKVILLLYKLDEEAIINAISLGVMGCLTDKAKKDQFIEAIRTVRKGWIWIEIRIMTNLLTHLLPIRKGKLVMKSKLTKKEGEIVNLIIQSYSNKQIAQKLSISENTVKTHLAHIFSKLGVTNRIQLIKSVS